MPCAIAHIVLRARIPVVASLPGRVCASRAVAQTSVVVAAREGNTGATARTANAAGAGFAHFLHAVSTCASRPGPGTGLAIGYLACATDAFIAAGAVIVAAGAAGFTNAIATRKSDVAARLRLAGAIAMAKAGGLGFVSGAGSLTPVITAVQGDIGAGPQSPPQVAQVARLAKRAIRGCPY